MCFLKKKGQKAIILSFLAFFVWTGNFLCIYLIFNWIVVCLLGGLSVHNVDCGKKSAFKACFARFIVFFSEKRFYF